MYKNTVTRTP